MKHLELVVMSCFIYLKMHFLITNNLPGELIFSMACYKDHITRHSAYSVYESTMGEYLLIPFF